MKRNDIVVSKTSREKDKEHCWKMIEKINEGKILPNGKDLRTKEDLERIDYWRNRLIFGD